MAGILYVVATPIGNLGDMTRRAIDVLSDVDVIASEDTRVTRRLLSHFDIENKCVSYHDNNEQYRSEELVKSLIDGNSVALVSDAGTPCISDPGYRVVNLAKQSGIEVVSVPGPSAVTAALSISGLPTDHFFFEGFLPKKKGRQTRFQFLSSLEASIVVFQPLWVILVSFLYVEKSLKNLKKHSWELLVTPLRIFLRKTQRVNL